MTALQIHRLKAGFNGRLELPQTLMITVRILLASALMAAVAWGVWSLLDGLLGRLLPAQVISVGLGIAAGTALYAWLVLAMRIPEARQIRHFVLGRLGRLPPTS
jgi:putative peptidoglycan lipid II flippase